MEVQLTTPVTSADYLENGVDKHQKANYDCPERRYEDRTGRDVLSQLDLRSSFGVCVIHHALHRRIDQL